MAQSIIRLGRDRAIFYFEFTPVTYLDRDGQTKTYVPTPAPTEGDVFEILSAAQLAALDDGSAAYAVSDVRVDDNAADPDQLLSDQFWKARDELAQKVQDATFRRGQHITPPNPRS